MKRLFTLIFSLTLAISLQARDNGQFFKKLTGKNIAVENVEQRFAEWFPCLKTPNGARSATAPTSRELNASSTASMLLASRSRTHRCLSMPRTVWSAQPTVWSWSCVALPPGFVATAPSTTMALPKTSMEDMDEGGVHKNSSVQNKWFYLLTEGGEGTNDYEFSYNVEGIGMEKALKIAYLTLTSYATMESDYAAIYMASLEAAEVLFGDNSKELQAVAAAWEAVGVADSDLTGIEQTYEMDAQDGRYFDLQGRALSELPTERGVYIINGKKVVIK